MLINSIKWSINLKSDFLSTTGPMFGLWCCKFMLDMEHFPWKFYFTDRSVEATNVKIDEQLPTLIQNQGILRSTKEQEPVYPSLFHSLA